MANARDRLIKFQVQLELDPQALAKVETQFKQLTDERKRIQRRVDGPKKDAALDANTKKLNDLMQERIGLEEALAALQKKNNATESAATKKQVTEQKQKIDLKKTEKKAEEDLTTAKEKTRKTAADADAKETAAAKKRIDLKRAELKLAEDELRTIQKKAALPGQVSHYNKARQAANTLAGITSVANMTPEQLEKAKAIWNQYAATVKKADAALFNHINGNLARHKAQNQARLKLERDLNKNLQDLGKMRAKAQKDGDAELLRIIKNTEQQLKQQHKKQEEEERRHQRELRRTQSSGRGNRGVFGEVPSAGRGLVSGLAGMGGLNLYGLGAVVGGGGALIKASVGAYAEVFALKNVLSGIITTFNQFKDAAGKPVSRAENFNKSIGYSEYIYQRLRKAAVDSPLTLKELSDVYTTGYPFLARQGVSAEKSIGIANTVASLGKAMGLRLDSIKDDIRAIYEGRFRNVQTFQAAGFTAGDFKKLSTLQGDDLVNFFNEKFSGYQSALKRFSGSFVAQWDNMIDSLYQSGAILGEKVAPVFVDFAKSVRENLGQMAADGTLDRFATQFKSTLEVLSSGLNFLVNSVGTVGQGLMSVITSILNGANNLLNGGKAAAGNMFFDNMRRGVEAVTFQSDNWKPEVKTFLGKMRGDMGPVPSKGTAAYSDYTLKLQALRLGALETLQNSKNPRALIAAHRDLVSDTQARAEALNAVDTLQAYTSTVSGNKGNEKLRPAAQSALEQLKNLGFAGSNATVFNTAPGELRRTIISGYDQVKKEAFAAAPITDLIGLESAMSFLQSQGYDTRKIMKPGASYDLSKDKDFLKIVDKFRSSVGPTPILTPKIDTKSKAGSGRNVTQTIPRDFSAQINAIAAVDREINSIESRISSNPKRSIADIERLTRDRQLLGEAESRKVIAASKLQQLQATPDQKYNFGKSGGKVSYLRSIAKGGAVLNPELREQLDTLAAITGFNIQVGATKDDHGKFVKSTNRISDHYSGDAVDIPMINGLATNTKTNPKGAALMDQLVSVAESLGFTQILWRTGGHYNHGHFAKSRRNPNGRGSIGQRLLPKADLSSYKTGGKLTTAMITKGAKADANLPVALEEIQRKIAEGIQSDMVAIEQLKREQAARRTEVQIALLELELDVALASGDPATKHAAESKLLKARNSNLFGGGIAGAIYTATHLPDMLRYKKDQAGLDRGLADAENQKYQEGIEARIARERTANDVKRAENARLFQNRMSLTGKFGSDATLIGLDQKISKYEGDLDKGGLYTVFAQHYLPALYAQKKALEENTESLNRMREEKLQTATDRIFNGFGQSGFAESYQGGFNRKMSRIDSMLPGEISKVRAGLGIAGMGMSDDQIKFMMKSNAMSGYSREDYVRQQYKDQAASGVEQAMQAILAGEDPITALSSTFQNITGMESMKRLTSALFNKGRGYKGEDGKGPFNRGQFTKDLISGGGSFGAQYIVNQALPQNSYAQEGSQLGGLAASMGAFAGLGAWAGPVGILAGGLIGSLFGKKKAPDPAVEQHRKRLEELLETISNRLRPQEDFYRMFKGVYGAESRRFAGRGSVLGSNAALGAI